VPKGENAPSLDVLFFDDLHVIQPAIRTKLNPRFAAALLHPLCGDALSFFLIEICGTQRLTLARAGLSCDAAHDFFATANARGEIAARSSGNASVHAA
jgi:hypothetical protein